MTSRLKALKMCYMIEKEGSCKSSRCHMNYSKITFLTPPSGIILFRLENIILEGGVLS